MIQKLSFSYESTFESNIADVHLRPGQKALQICTAIDLHSWQIDNFLSLSLQKMF